MIKLYLARDKDNTLTLFKSKPINHADTYWMPREEVDCGNYISLPDDAFPELTFENSPKVITLNELMDIKG